MSSKDELFHTQMTVDELREWMVGNAEVAFRMITDNTTAGEDASSKWHSVDLGDGKKVVGHQCIWRLLGGWSEQKVREKGLEELRKEWFFLTMMSIRYSRQQPWEDIYNCLSDRIPRRSGWSPCPICGKPSEDLMWIHFSSSPSSWMNLCGRSGPLSVCPNCHWPVDFECLCMS